MGCRAGSRFCGKRPFQVSRYKFHVDAWELGTLNIELETSRRRLILPVILRAEVHDLIGSQEVNEPVVISVCAAIEAIDRAVVNDASGIDERAKLIHASGELIAVGSPGENEEIHGAAVVVVNRAAANQDVVARIS